MLGTPAVSYLALTAAKKGDFTLGTQESCRCLLAWGIVRWEVGGRNC
jgi:hypothetical protein